MRFWLLTVLFLGILPSKVFSETDSQSQILIIGPTKRVGNVQDVFRIFTTQEGTILAEKYFYDENEEVAFEELENWIPLCINQFEPLRNDVNGLVDVISMEMESSIPTFREQIANAVLLILVVGILAAVISLSEILFALSMIGIWGAIIIGLFTSQSSEEISLKNEGIVKQLESLSEETFILDSDFYDIGSEKVILKVNETLLSLTSPKEDCISH